MDATIRSLSIVTLVLSLAFCTSKQIEYLNLEAPFDSVDSSGQRQLGDNWRVGGDVEIRKHFIRLTPDRQSRKGAVWSTNPIRSRSMAAMLDFRIHGQAKTFFGDGIGLWITQSSRWLEGDFHGISEHFKGIGIVFDTFKNTEYGESHRDVMVVFNNGDKSHDQLLETMVGCDMNVRYQSSRADFNALTDQSRVMVHVKENNMLVIDVDPKGNNNWIECTVKNQLPFDANWLEEAYVGITASTGSLADNHDLLSLHVYETLNELEQELKKHPRDIKAQKLMVGPSENDEEAASMDPIARIKRLEGKLQVGYNKLVDFDRHLEHELASVTEHVEHLLHQLESREDTAEQRLNEIEELVNRHLENENEKEGNMFSHTVPPGLDDKIQEHIEDTLSKVDGKIEEIKRSKAQGGGGSWKTPFVILALLMVGCIVGLYMYMKHLKKKHYL
jgi:mannose-binding lectin 2